MTITRYPPNTIWLGGPRTEIGDIAAAEVIKPGYLVERVNTAGVWRWKKWSVDGGKARAVATEQSMLNKSVNDDYAAGDLMEVTEAAPGTNLWLWINSGQNIAYGDKLQAHTDGSVKILAAGEHIFTALETQANVQVATRIRVETA